MASHKQQKSLNIIFCIRVGVLLVLLLLLQAANCILFYGLLTVSLGYIYMVAFCCLESKDVSLLIYVVKKAQILNAFVEVLPLFATEAIKHYTIRA